MRFAVKSGISLTTPPISDSARTKGLSGRSDGFYTRGDYGLPSIARLMRATEGSPLWTFLCGRAEGVRVLSTQGCGPI